VLGDGAPQSILAARITPEFFDTIGIRPSIGRRFTGDEHGPGGERAVILSHDFWQGRYGGDHSIVGRRIRLSGPEFLPDSSGDYVVVGILPQRFWLFWKRIEIVVPLRITPAQLADRRRPAIETVTARLSRDVQLDVVGSQLRDVTAGLTAQYGSTEPVASAALEQAQSALYKEFTAPLLVVLTSAVLMFVLAAVNVAAMLIALALARRREFAIRAALVAQKRWFVKQALAEGAVLGASAAPPA
jgi:MacB-like periplasmic core domain